MDYKVFALVLFIFVLFFFSLIKPYGYLRAFFISFCRLLLIFPILLSLSPKKLKKRETSYFTKKEIPIFLDDSLSLKESFKGNQSYFSLAQEKIKKLHNLCQTLSCSLKVTTLSEASPLTKRGYSPLAHGLNKWLLETKEKPSLMITDGKDYLPAIPWEKKLPLKENPSKEITLLSFEEEKSKNIWFDEIKLPQLGFHTKKIEVLLSLKRWGAGLEKQPLQIQVLSAGKIIETKTVYFLKGLGELHEVISIKPLSKGKHILSFKILKTPGESSYLDNTMHKKIEILPNTKGILHLLGAPSWDGRFLRKSIKSEPKYDLVSFFILRNHTDKQKAKNRELSLIPFPAERLFTEELKNFHLIIMQNFSLFKFLRPRYQENLVKFVKEGGGLLFLGGNKALKKNDLKKSPLKEIFPFTQSSNLNFKENENFTIKLASPTEEQINLASLYYDFYDLKEYLEKKNGFKGLHPTHSLKFKKSYSTPLLNYETTNGTVSPLAIASYPGKGRALWFFTDSLWKLAFSEDGETPRGVYNKLINSSLKWLQREENLKPLVLTDVTFSIETENDLKFEAHLEGSSLKYFQTKKTHLSFFVCSEEINPSNLNFKLRGENLGIMKGTLRKNLTQKNTCEVKIKARHPNFGEEISSYITLLPKTVKDSEQAQKTSKAEELAHYLSGELIHFDSDTDRKLFSWLKGITKREKRENKVQMKISQNTYWPLDKKLILLLLFLIPLEVIIRKWKMP